MKDWSADIEYREKWINDFYQNPWLLPAIQVALVLPQYLSPLYPALKDKVAVQYQTFSVHAGMSYKKATQSSQP